MTGKAVAADRDLPYNLPVYRAKQCLSNSGAHIWLLFRYCRL